MKFTERMVESVSSDRTATTPSQLAAFAAMCASNTSQHFKDYLDFEQWCRNNYRTFWRLFLDWSKLPVEGDPTEVCRGDDCETAVFFPDIRLNYTDVLLREGADQPAITACHRDSPSERLSRSDLTDRVARLAAGLHRLDVMPGDRVVAIGRNNAEVMIAALASACIGATFSSCATDMGVPSILARFEVLRPVLMFANLEPASWDIGDPLSQRVSEIIKQLPTIRNLIALDSGACDTFVPTLHLSDFKNDRPGTWPRFPFNHPLFILFSSGTTGAPKCIVHGAGGTLLEHLKEHRLHCNLSGNDKLFFQTSCGWMMWNWQLSALATGAEIMVYDGPLDGPDTLWRLVAEEHVTVFGTNPAYLQFCEDAGLTPAKAHDLSHLRSILSTGSILYPHQFDWVTREVKDIPVQSISGGTDIIGCFVLGNPDLPVHRGEAQSRSLGLDVRAIDGELVCGNPFPSCPLGFFNDPGRARFHEAYFSQHPDVWTHGDLIEFTESGGAILHGRSDGVLNIRGIRIGPAEIYRLLQGMSEIINVMAVEQVDAAHPGGARLILLVVLHGTLDAALVAKIRSHLMRYGTAAMVPAQIIQVDALPTTHSGKYSETAARDAVNGRSVRNRDALRNPECLDQIAERMVQRPIGSIEGGEGQPTEMWLQRLCEQVFGVRGIGWTDNLLQYGDSLTVLNLYLEVNKATNHSLPWLTVAPTVSQLAAVLRNEQVASDGEHVSIRPATLADKEAVTRLLHAGFSDVAPEMWDCLFDYPWSKAPPTWGFALVANEKIVGYLGALYADRAINGKQGTVCNLTTWYIDPAYRGWGAAMIDAILATDPSLTYTVLTAAPLPKQIFKAMNFDVSTDHSIVLFPLLNLRLTRRPQISFKADEIRPYLPDVERRILDDHQQTDCLHMLVRDGDEQAYLLAKRRRYPLHRWLPWMVSKVRVSIAASKVLYCSNPSIVTRHLEWIKLAFLWKQHTVAMLLSERWFETPPRGIAIDSEMLSRSPIFAARELDALYSEVCLLPI